VFIAKKEKFRGRLNLPALPTSKVQKKRENPPSFHKKSRQDKEKKAKLATNSNKSIIFAELFTLTLFTNSFKFDINMAYVISDSCVACGTCQSVCPADAISEGDIYKIDPDTCLDCGTCADACPTGAIAPGE